MIGAVETRGVHCGACGSAEVVTDTVEHRGWLWIAECRHCDHRWTRALGPTPEAAARPIARVLPGRRPAEVASAA